MNLFGDESWNGPGSILASRHLARATPNITVQQANAAEERGGGYAAPPRDWPRGDDEEDDEEEGGHMQAAPPPIPVCQEFVFEPVPPASPPRSATLSGFGQDAEAPPTKRPVDPAEQEESLVDDILSDMGGGARGSPYFSNRRRRPEEPPPSKRMRASEPDAGLSALRALRQSEEQESRQSGEFHISTDCCKELDGGALYDETLGETVSGDPTRVWCFGCQWGAHNHRPIDNQKIADLVKFFMNLILNGSTTLENTASMVSDMYRRTIQQPARVQGQWLPDWPPAVVKRHIENMTEPRIRNTLLIRKNQVLLNVAFANSVRVNSQSGEREMNMSACNMWCRLLREMRELERQVPKNLFGYNPQFLAESWSGSTLVHPTRVQRPARAEDENGGADIRKYVMGSGVVDSGVPRGPGNDEELVSRPVGGTLSAESGC